MEVIKANETIDNILNDGAIEAGIFISLFSNEYINKFNITKEQFFKSLENSLKILEEQNEKESITSCKNKNE